MKPVAGILVLGLAAASAHAEIYVCEQDGRKSFSEHPCGQSAREVQTVIADDRIRMEVPMSEESLKQFCGVVVKAWEQARVNRSNASVVNPRRRYYHREGETYNSERIRAFVYSRVRNLPEIAAEYPGLYRRIESLVSRLSPSGDLSSYLYDSERARIRQECERELVEELDGIYRSRS